SRRRHTRCYRDWSSDVCSSDLSVPPEVRVQRFSDTALSGYGRRAVAILEREGVPALAAYLDGLERSTRIHAVLIRQDGRDASGHAVTPRVAAAAARAGDAGHPDVEADGGVALKGRRIDGA